MCSSTHEFLSPSSSGLMKAFLEAYKEWGIWFETPELELTYYRYQLPDGTMIIVQEHINCSYSRYGKGHEYGTGTYYYVQKQNEPSFSPEFKQCLSFVADLLKDVKAEMQKKGKTEG